MTMVAVDEKLRPNPNIPAVVYDDAEEEKRINKILLSRKEANENWQQCQKVRAASCTCVVQSCVVATLVS